MSKSKTPKKQKSDTFVIDKSKVKPAPQNKLVVYTIFGSHDDLEGGQPVLTRKNADRDNLAYAKLQKIGEQETYFVRIGDTGELFNPNAPLPNDKHHKFKMLGQDKTGLFEKVNKECFNYYLDYLKSRNPLHYKFATRSR